MDFFVKEALLALMIGTTHYVDTGPQGEAVIYYEDASQAHMRLGNGAVWSGDWRLTNSGYHVAWDEGPAGDWQIGRASDSRFVYVDGTGAERGDIKRIVPGNPEALGK